MVSAPIKLPSLDEEIGSDRIRKTMFYVALFASISAGFIFAAFQDGGRFYQTYLWASLAIAGASSLSLWLSYKVSTAHLALVLVAFVIVVTTYLIVDFGSIRMGATTILFCTVVISGILLGRHVMVTVLAINIVLLGIINYSEIQGFFPRSGQQPTIMTWYMIATNMVFVAAMVDYSRSRTEMAFQKQVTALEANKRLVQERDRSLAHLTRIFRTCPTPMLAQSISSRNIVDINPAFERCFGLSREALLGETDHMLWAHPAQRSAHFEELKQAGRLESRTLTGVRSNGTQFDASIVSEMDDQQDGGLVITMITDITAQNEALERLKRSEELFSKAFNLSPLNLIITRESDDRVIEINQAMAPGVDRLRKTNEDLRASAAGPWFSTTDRALFFAPLNANGHVHGYEAVLGLPDRSRIQAKVWAEKIEIDNQACVLTCIVDTTEEKRRENLLRDIASGMTGHTAQAFFDALTKHMSSALGADMILIGEVSSNCNVKTLSASRQGELVPNFSFLITETIDLERLQLNAPTEFSSKLNNESGQPTLEGDTQFGACIGQALHNLEGQPIGLIKALWSQPIQPGPDALALMSIFASRATAELLRLHGEREVESLNSSLEIRVQERTAELQKLNKELDSFAYTISHDLRSPLRAIEGFNQLLKERIPSDVDGESHQLIQRSLAAAHRMSALLTDLLRLARVSQAPMKIERFDLTDMVEAVISASTDMARAAEVRWQVEPGMQATGDVGLTRIVLENLIDNALKYSRKQSAPLIEFFQRADENNSQLSPFCIRDNGVGFSMEHADKLFQPFQRLHMPSEGFEGTGIGLATVRRIVERHGGVISAQATPGKGAEFQFTLGQSNNGSPPAGV